MSDQITITLNGQKVETSAEATIREVAEANGTKIPTFCHDDRLKPFAACFLCVVEVEGARTLLPACSTRVAPDMVIHTDSEKVHTSRRMALDLTLSDHAGDCIAPCESTCPANIDIQGYVAHIANGNFESAVRLIKRRNPLPVVCGRICPHPCESECRRALVDEAIAINPLKRFSSEYELEQGPFVVPPGEETGKKVAVIGGGPAGLAAAQFLRELGHGVEIFEALPELGGMARYGIPRFRMPWDLMDREIKAILDMGVTVHHNQRLGTDFSVQDLKDRGFGAVLLAIGAHKPKPMRIENEDVPGVMGGVDFLREVVLGNEVEVGKSVAVIGGGDTAMDCCRVARRLGADVTLLYRRTQAEMPSLPIEQEETEEEGVEFRFLTAPVEVLMENGKSVGLKVITMELGEPDASGRRRPVPIEGSEEDLNFDLVIPAIGQDPDLSCIDNEAEKPETTRWRTFIYDENTCVTSVDGVFAAGDCAFGPDIVIRAVGEGRKAALAIDQYLNGAEVKLEKEYAISRGRLADLEMADYSPRFVHKKRALESVQPAEVRLTNEDGWAPINMGLEQVQAMAEASRCIECGCNARFDCDLRNYATEYGADESRIAGDKRNYEEDTRHPLIKIESDKCITCASCVRICSEVREINALSFIKRGFSTKIGPVFGEALTTTECDACGMCTDVCPTGTLSANTGKETGPWISNTTVTTCTSCSKGCGLEIHVAEGNVVKVRSVNGDPVNGASICAEGRFNYQLMNGEIPSGSPNALELGRNILFEAQKVVVLVSPQLTVEETFAAARLARDNGGDIYYATGTGITGEEKPFGKMRGEGNIALLNRLGAKRWSPGVRADCIVLVDAPVSAQDAEGAKIISISSVDLNIESACRIIVSDPLLASGTFLNRDGSLTVLNAAVVNAPVEVTMLSAIAALTGQKSLTDIGFIRAELAKEVSELAALTKLNGERVIETALKPEPAPVALSGRGQAFAAHMQGKGLSWS
ncbi:MAG: FAD-dependent oxidoreductase [Magnetococcales bacterium]|nr:FAD-dependent oxidoreductase [Magnetococcales bacterium]